MQRVPYKQVQEKLQLQKERKASPNLPSADHAKVNEQLLEILHQDSQPTSSTEGKATHYIISII